MIIEKLERAVHILENSPEFAQLIPEVRSNLVMAKRDAPMACPVQWQFLILVLHPIWPDLFWESCTMILKGAVPLTLNITPI